MLGGVDSSRTTEDSFNNFESFMDEDGEHTIIVVGGRDVKSTDSAALSMLDSPYMLGAQSTSGAQFTSTAQSTSAAPFTSASQSTLGAQFTSASQSTSTAPFTLASQSSSAAPFTSASQSMLAASSTPAATNQKDSSSRKKKTQAELSQKLLEAYMKQMIDMGQELVAALNRIAHSAEILVERFSYMEE